jgi:hypothetical protein
MQLVLEWESQWVRWATDNNDGFIDVHEENGHIVHSMAFCREIRQSTIYYFLRNKQDSTLESPPYPRFSHV